MPYIKDRIGINYDLHNLCYTLAPREIGDLDYAITRLINTWIIEKGGDKFERYCTVHGMLGLIQHELERRCIDPYEDQKMRENGDVFPSQLMGVPLTRAVALPAEKVQ